MSERGHVVVAEDDADCRALICAVLEQRGLSVAGAPSAAEAEDLARSLRPDLLILDLGLPDATGAETVRRFRQDDEFSNTPILLVSAEVRGPVMAEAIAAGANGYVPKPFSPTVLLEAVDELLGPRP
jgi:CheY-like chemotaxis protein